MTMRSSIVYAVLAFVSKRYRGAHLDSNQDSEFNIQILGEGFVDHFLLFFLCIHHGLFEYFHWCTKIGNRDYDILY